MDTDTDAISFDAYEYSDKIALYSEDLTKFLNRGGLLAWGIVPTSNEKIVQESVDNLLERLEQNMQLMVDRGIDKQILLRSSFITPSCATVSMSVEMSEKAFQYTSEISSRMREKFFQI